MAIYRSGDRGLLHNPMNNHDKKTLSLVLGSGGARGLAHIGVIRVLEEEGFEICSVSGCSIGALIGGIFAAGKLGEFENWVRTLTKLDVIKLLDISWTREGLIRGNKFFKSLEDLIGDQDIESLPIRFTAVAVDIVNQKEVWISKGPLFQAIRASISLPMFFTPAKYGDSYLVDGSVLNPIPIAPTLSEGMKDIVAVNLAGEFDRNLEGTQNSADRIFSSLEGVSILNKLKMKLGLDKIKRSEKRYGMHEVANLAYDSMQGAISRHKLSAYPPDKKIDIPRNAAGLMDFYRADELIELGRQKTIQHLDSLKAL